MLLRFEDPNEPKEIFSEYLIETEVSEWGLQRYAEKIARGFESGGFEDWSYDDIIKQMEEKGLLKILDYDRYVLVL